MAKRKHISKKIRFEVYKRDSFTCQYCGRKAPDVELEVDHIKPVAKGGSNDIMNLVTSCVDCNRGKSDRELDDNSVVEKQRTQLEKLQARNEQLKMMLQWREELANMEDMEVDAVEKVIERHTGDGINDVGKRIIRNLIKKNGLAEVIECTEIAFTAYYKVDDDFEYAFKKITSIIKSRQAQENDPCLYLKNKLCKYISKKFADRYDRHEMMKLLDDCNLMPNEEEMMFDLLKEANTWDELVDALVEQAEIVADVEEAHRWLEKNGYQKGS